MTKLLRASYLAPQQCVYHLPARSCAANDEATGAMIASVHDASVSHAATVSFASAANDAADRCAGRHGAVAGVAPLGKHRIHGRVVACNKARPVGADALRRFQAVERAGLWLRKYSTQFAFASASVSRNVLQPRVDRHRAGVARRGTAAAGAAAAGPACAARAPASAGRRSGSGCWAACSRSRAGFAGSVASCRHPLRKAAPSVRSGARPALAAPRTSGDAAQQCGGARKVVRRSSRPRADVLPQLEGARRCNSASAIRAAAPRSRLVSDDVFRW